MTKSKYIFNASSSNLIIGIDIGTSGIRACLVEPETNSILASFSVTMPLPKRVGNSSEQDPFIWIKTLNNLFKKVNQHDLSKYIKHLVVDATSSSVLLISQHGKPLSPALMYDDKRASLEAKEILNIAPSESAVHGSSSTLAKVMWLEKHLKKTEEAFICHQVDFINFYLTGKLNLSDENNALKLGYNSVKNCWPEWIENLTALKLPKINKPGEKIAKLSIKQILKSPTWSHLNSDKLMAIDFLKQDIQVYFGTTDSIAAFLATGANKIGDAVSSLGSTIVIKIITKSPIFNKEYGIYSHRIRSFWLTGGASNAGGAVLLKYFTLTEVIDMLPKLEIDEPTGLNYYPLISKGERFPISNHNFKPKLSPRPSDDKIFLQGLIEGLTEIERLGFERLLELGSGKINRIFTAGGGQKNTAWMALRERNLGIPLASSKETDASFGVTQLIRHQVKEELNNRQLFFTG